ncbi:MAG: ABC transporter permease, partial [Flavihumibacter sp.]|nr:ABC transporter permease [Flavihumibacter sp.]
MLRSYVQIAWRNLIKQPYFSGINVFGLSIGLCFSLFIGIYIWQENNVNKNLRNLSNQYILQTKWKKNNQGIEWTTLGALPKEIKETYPNLVANYFRFDGINAILHIQEKSFRQSVAIVDSTLFSMYGFKLLEGNQRTALDEPYSVVLSEKLAIRYFGSTNVINKTIELENFNRIKHPFKITGVTETIPRNTITHLNDDNHNELFIPVSNLEFFGRSMEWNNPYIVGFIELQNNVTPAQLIGPIKKIIESQAHPSLAENIEVYLMPLENYYQTANNGIVQKTNWILGLIGFFILSMALINFINLTSSKSHNRLKEVGIRTIM